MNNLCLKIRLLLLSAYSPVAYVHVAYTFYCTHKNGGSSKLRPRVQRATGPRLLRDRVLTTRLSRHQVTNIFIRQTRQRDRQRTDYIHKEKKKTQQ